MRFLGCVSRRSSGKKTVATAPSVLRLKLNDDPGSTPLNHKRLARIMKDLGLCGYTRRRRVKTTVRAKGRNVFADLVRRRFYADGLNKLYAHGHQSARAEGSEDTSNGADRHVAG
ncbi:IS3 family transposase [Corynebacterium glucuronolyticum]|nr:IS3 family transposase [Corynebacterium glucuronolyticum]QRO83039.1 IS3 family transposase [Corynebacterium glucuronolyticum]